MKEIIKNKTFTYLFSVILINITRILKLKRNININEKFPNELRIFQHLFIKKSENTLLIYRLKFEYKVNFKRNKKQQKLPVFKSFLYEILKTKLLTLRKTLIKLSNKEYIKANNL